MLVDALHTYLSRPVQSPSKSITDEIQAFVHVYGIVHVQFIVFSF